MGLRTAEVAKTGQNSVRTENAGQNLSAPYESGAVRLSWAMLAQCAMYVPHIEHRPLLAPSDSHPKINLGHAITAGVRIKVS